MIFRKKARKRHKLVDLEPKQTFVLNGVRHFLINPPEGHYHSIHMAMSDDSVVSVIYDPHDVLEISEHLSAKDVDKKNTVFIVGSDVSYIVGVEIDESHMYNEELSSVVATMAMKPPSQSVN